MAELDNQIHYWNRLGPAKPFGHPVNFERLGGLLHKDSRILDFGCGYGRVAGLLCDRGYGNVIGVDPALAMIDAARTRFPYISFQLVDPPHLDLADSSIDAIFVFAVLTCIPTDNGQRSIIRELGRILRPGGLLYVSDLWLQTDERNLKRYAEGYSKYGTYGVFDLPEGVTLRHQDRHWIASLTSSYERLFLDEIEVETMNGNTAACFQWFGRKIPLDVA